MRKGLKSSSKGQFVNPGLLKNIFKVTKMLLAKFPLTNLWKIFAVAQHIRSEWIATVDQQGMHVPSL